MLLLRLSSAGSPLHLRLIAVVSATAFLLSAPAVLAQPSSPASSGDTASTTYDAAPPAHLAAADGAVQLDRDGVDEAAPVGMPVVGGDRLRTARGRAELLYPDGTSVALDEFTTVEVQSDVLLRLTAGRLRLFVTGTAAASGAGLQVDTPAGSAFIRAAGEYVVGLLGTPSMTQLEVAVRRGRADLVTEAGSMPLRSGERSTAWATSPPTPPQYFNSARADALDAWATLQRDARLGARSAQYLPPDLRTYSGTFDRYGAWDYDASYGYVWYPTVATGWRPYYNGYWASVPRYGWTWIGLDRWGWPTHHYGRWGFARSRWFWIPDRRWGPAWVAWGAAPGYVSWSPLGWDNRPLFGLSVSIGNAWDGWVVLPRDRFGMRGAFVSQYAVPQRALPPRLPFVVQSAPPIAPRHAPARVAAGGAPVRDTGRRAGGVVERAPGQPFAPRRDDGRAGNYAVPRDPAAQQRLLDRTIGPGGPIGSAPGGLQPGDDPRLREGGRADDARPRAPGAVRRDAPSPGYAPTPGYAPPNPGYAPLPGTAPAPGRAGSAAVPRRNPGAPTATVPFGDFRGDDGTPPPLPPPSASDRAMRRAPSEAPPVYGPPPRADDGPGNRPRPDTGSIMRRRAPGDVGAPAYGGGAPRQERPQPAYGGGGAAMRRGGEPMAAPPPDGGGPRGGGARSDGGRADGRAHDPASRRPPR